MRGHDAATRLVAALLLTGCAVFLLLLARDVWHWGRAMHLTPPLPKCFQASESSCHSC